MDKSNKLKCQKVITKKKESEKSALCITCVKWVNLSTWKVGYV